jgi:hypothetical protein
MKNYNNLYDLCVLLNTQWKQKHTVSDAITGIKQLVKECKEIEECDLSVLTVPQSILHLDTMVYKVNYESYFKWPAEILAQLEHGSVHYECTMKISSWQIESVRSSGERKWLATVANKQIGVQIIKSLNQSSLPLRPVGIVHAK